MKLEQPMDLYNLIYEIVENRVYKFNKEQIDEFIQLKLKLLEVDNYYMDDYSEFLLQVLDHLQDKRELIYSNGIYLPVETMIRREYPVDSNMIVYSKGLIRGEDYYMEDSEELLDVDSCCVVSKMVAGMVKPIVLTGYLVGDGNYQQPDVSLEELHHFYHKFIYEGATVKETIQYILNYYHAVSLEDNLFNEKYPNRYKITSKVRKRRIC